jgi:hypothetical protein
MGEGKTFIPEMAWLLLFADYHFFSCFNIFSPLCFIELSSFALSKPIFFTHTFRKQAFFPPFWHAAPRAIFQASFHGEMK